MPPRKRKATEAEVDEGEEPLTTTTASKAKASKSKVVPAKKTKKDVEEENEDESEGQESGTDEEEVKKGKGKAKSNGKGKAKAKVAKAPVQPLDPSLPVNTVFPAVLKPFPRPGGGEEEAIRISNWNVCGLAAALRKGFKFYLEAEDPDILILTETKVNTPQSIPELDDKYKHRYWGIDANKKGYAGTAVFSKIEPLKVIMGLPTSPKQADTHGRMITLEFPNSYVVATYTPNAGDKLKNLDAKNKWNEDFEEYIRQLDGSSKDPSKPGKPIIWTGDINCAPTEKDLRNAKQCWNKQPGYTEAECGALSSQMNPEPESGYGRLVDVWRERNVDKVGHYTYYSYRFSCRTKGIGWRLDSFILSERIVPKVKDCLIRSECYGASDHVPIVLDIQGPL